MWCVNWYRIFNRLFSFWNKYVTTTQTAFLRNRPDRILRFFRDVLFAPIAINSNVTKEQTNRAFPSFQRSSIYSKRKRRWLCELTQSCFICVTFRIKDAEFIGELCTSDFSLNDVTVTFDLLTLARDILDGGGRSYRSSCGDSDDVSYELHLRSEVSCVSLIHLPCW